MSEIFKQYGGLILQAVGVTIIVGILFADIVNGGILSTYVYSILGGSI